MSNVSIIYDQIKVIIDTLFTGVDTKIKLPNPYLLEENPMGMLKNGWGMTVGPSERPDFEFKSILQAREFNLVLIRELIRMDSDTTIFEDLEKVILEDVAIIQERFEQTNQIGIESNIENITLGSCSGIEFLQGDNETVFFDV